MPVDKLSVLWQYVRESESIEFTSEWTDQLETSDSEHNAR